LEVDQSTVSRLESYSAVERISNQRFDLDRQQELQRLAMLEKEYWQGGSGRSSQDFFNERLATGKDELEIL